jgi:Ca2+ transporting ATPase
MELGHTKTWQEVLDYYGTNIDKGLSEEQVRKNQEKYGPNG